MKLYTAEAIAIYLDMSTRNVRNLRKKKIIRETKPGLYELIPTVNAYINYLRGEDGSSDSYTEERAKLTRAKAEAAEMETRLRKGELHETAEVEQALSTFATNLRSRALGLPAKLTPSLAQMGGDNVGIYDLLDKSMRELLEETSKYEAAFALPEGSEDERGRADRSGAAASGRNHGKEKAETPRRVRKPGKTK